VGVKKTIRPFLSPSVAKQSQRVAGGDFSGVVVADFAAQDIYQFIQLRGFVEVLGRVSQAIEISAD
jgi:hypothetical protein